METALLLFPKGIMGVAVLAALALDSLKQQSDRRMVLRATIALLVVGVVGAVIGVGRTASFMDGALLVDHYTVFADIVLLVLGVVVSVAALDTVGARDEAGDFFLLLFLALAGSSALASAGNLIVVFLAVELAIIPTFALVAFRADDRRSFEAAIKYFLLSVFASAVLIFGMSLVYGATGSIRVPFDGEVAVTGLLLVGLSLVLVGFGFKLAAFPFHQWLPDAFEVSRPEVAAFLAVGPKLAAVVALVRILEGFGVARPAWTAAVAAIALGTMVWGNLGAFRQDHLPRLLAYSAIAHAGYALVGVAGGGIRGMDGAVVYFAAYGSAAVGVFLVIAMLAERGIGDRLDDLVGLGRVQPWIAGAMTVFMVSMIGIPLFAGFWGKFSVFLGAVEGGVVWLAVVGVLNSAASFGYYGSIIKSMYVDEPRAVEDPRVEGEPVPVAAAGSVQTDVEPGGGVAMSRWMALATAVALTLVIGVAPVLLLGPLGL